jgi:hypothetical protein
MRTIDCWSIRVWDGADRHNHKFYVASYDEAAKWLEQNKYDTVEMATIVVFDDLNEAMENDLKLVKDRTLAKLTPLERRSLGYA